MSPITNSEPADSEEELMRLIAQSQRRLYAFILPLVRRSAEAEDILQETNVVLWRKRDLFQPGSNFLAWAFEISRMQILAWRNRHGRRSDLFDEALISEIAMAAIEESEHDQARAAALAECLKKLPERHRTLILRRYQSPGTVNLMAAELGKSAKAVSESLRRIRETLRRCIERTLSAESSG